MNNTIKYDGLLAFHPGSYIDDIIEDLNITQKEFAERLDINPKVLSELVNGETNLSPEVALKLEKLTGVEYQSWMNLQNTYERKKLEIEKKMLEDEEKVARSIDFRFFKIHGFVENKRYSLKEKIKELRNILNISNLCYLMNFNPAVSYRNISEFDENTIINSNVMLEIATNEARNRTENKLNKIKLEESLPLIRGMLNSPDVNFYPELKRILLDCGIVLVGLPNLKNSGLQGATKKFKNGSVMLLITDRNKRADIFWFSLMHEIAHILYNDFYTDREDETSYLFKEDRADKWASEFFIKDYEYNQFVDNNNFSKKSIEEFSKKSDILPCILTGRLKNDGHLKHSELNEFTIQYKFSLN